jgi:hypothetical protein
MLYDPFKNYVKYRYNNVMSTCIKPICFWGLIFNSFRYRNERFVLSLHHCDQNENTKEFVQKPQEKNENQT